MGYADVGCFGATSYTTPHIDRLAWQGMRFTDFYVAQAVCSASRVALLTGCYPNRVGIKGALGPQSKIGINSNEVTIAEMLKQRGYAALPTPIVNVVVAEGRTRCSRSFCKTSFCSSKTFMVNRSVCLQWTAPFLSPA